MLIPNNINTTQINKTNQNDDNLNLFFTSFLCNKGKYSTKDTNKFEEIIITNNHNNFTEYKKKQNSYLSSAKFWEHLFLSSEVLLVDKYFNKYMINTMINQLNKNYIDNKSLSIKILLNNKPKNRDELIEIDNIEEVNQIVQTRKKLTIEIYRSEMTFIHDRFAFMDNEMWHFGAAIGNMHYNLTAYSIHNKSESLCDYFIQELQSSYLLKDYLNAIQPTK